MEKRKKNKLELIILISIVAVIAIVVTIVATIRFGKKEPYDMIIRIYDPYTNELLAEVTSKPVSQNVDIEKTIIMYRNNPKALVVKLFYVDKKKEVDMSSVIADLPDNYSYYLGYTWRYDKNDNSDDGFISYTAEEPVLRNGLHVCGIALKKKADLGQEKTPRIYNDISVVFFYNVLIK